MNGTAANTVKDPVQSRYDISPSSAPPFRGSKRTHSTGRRKRENKRRKDVGDDSHGCSLEPCCLHVGMLSCWNSRCD
jgi:hypothetical protein